MPGMLRLHYRQEQQGELHQGGDVHFQLIAGHLPGHFGRKTEPGHTGVVDQHVQPAVMFHDVGIDCRTSCFRG